MLIGCDEVWRPVPSFPHHYEVSSRGRVRSLSRVARNGKGYKEYPGKIIKPDTVRGYKRVSMSVSGKVFRRTVHSLVMEVFAGACPIGHQVAHNDGDRANNNLDNLRYATVSQNHLDKRDHGTMSRGETNGRSKLTKDQVLFIRRHTELSSRALAKMFGITHTNVNYIRRRVAWCHLLEEEICASLV